MAEHTSVDARPSVPRRAARHAVNAAGWVVLAIVAWFAWPATLHGGTSYVLVSGESMLPTYEPRDMVIARSGEPEVGDVIVYAPQDLGGAQIVHRIIGGNAHDGWVLQGDNNDFIDPFEPTRDEVRGVVKVHLPYIGHVTIVLLNPLTWFFVLSLALAVLIWPSKGSGAHRSHDDDPPDATVDHQDAATTRAPRKLTGSVTGIAALVAAATLVTMASVTPASAAQLSVTTSAAPTAHMVARCADAALTATASGSTVTVSGVPSACRSGAGALLPVDVYAHAGTRTWSASVPQGASSGTLTVMPAGDEPFDPAAVDTVIVKIDGWLFVARWTFTPPAATAVQCEAINPAGNPSPGNGCTATITPASGSPWGYDNGTKLWNYHLNVTWTSNPTDRWRWRVTIDHSVNPPFPGFTPRFVGNNYNPGVVLAPGYTCAQLPILVLQGTSTSVRGIQLDVGDGTAPGYYSGERFCN